MAAGMCVLGAALLAMPVAKASDDQDAVATIEASTAKQVVQDEVHVTFSTQAEGKTAPAVNRKLAATLDQARQGYEVPDGVEISSGPFNVYLDHSTDNQSQGWIGRASLQLVSTDFDQASLAIEHFGQTMAVSSLGFSLSRQARQAYERQLMDDLAKDFAQRAMAASQAFGFKGYVLEALDFTNSANISPRLTMQRMDAAASVGESRSRLSLEPSMSTVEIRVTGRVRMHH
jgi:predicted secreted protein